MLPIVLEDVKPEIFMKLLSFLYCNKVTLYFDVVADYNVILDLLDISDRFRVPSLSNLLINFLETDTNALKIIGPELISQLKTKITPGQPSTPTSLSRQSSLSSTSSSTTTTTTGDRRRSDASGPNGSSSGGSNLKKFRPRSGTNQSDESDSLSDRMDDSDQYDEDLDAIQYNITSRSIQFSDTIKRRIAVAKLRIEEQARKMKADSEEIDWTCSKPDLLPPRVHHTASSFGNALVIIGGHDGNQNGVGSGVEFLIEPTDKPGSLVWTETRKTGAGPRTLHSHATCRVGNRFYTYGGIVDGERSSKLFIVAVINDETVHWSVPRLTGDLPPPLTHHTLLRYDKHLVLFGGFDGKEANADVWVMDTETNKWTKRSSSALGTSALLTPSLSQSSSSSSITLNNGNSSSPSSQPLSRPISPRFGHCSLIVGSKMLVLGGHDHLGNYFNDAMAYDLDTGVWTNLANKTTVPRMAFHSAVRVGRHILVYGGRRKSSGLVKELWKLIWDESGGEILWTKLKCASAPHERFGHSVNRIGSKIYVVGGCNERGKPFGDLCEANTVQLPLENNARVIDHSELEISSLVGMGNFSQVRRGIWNNNLIAIKLIKATSKTEPPAQKSKDKSKSIKDFKSEVELLSQLKHPNLVTFLGYCLEPNAIVMEYLPQNLHDYLIENRSKLESQQLLDFAYDIARGMEYLHRNSIIHRDLKSFNILLDENLNVKIADFGIARVKSNTSTMTTTGTIAWTAPEILRHEPYNEKSDVYSYAIVLWEIVSEGEIPFDSEDFQSPMEAGIAVAMGQLRPPLPQDTDANWAALIEKCWKEDPASRPSFTEIMDQIKKFEW
jgi:N-acetylneuraminic acid mutarotase